MKTVTASRFLALLAALLLTTAEFAVLDYDAALRQASFGAEASSVSAPRRYTHSWSR